MKRLSFIFLAFLALSCMRENPWEESPEGEIVFSVQGTKAQLIEDAASVADAYGSAGIGLIAYGFSSADGPRTRYPSGKEVYNSFDYDSRKAYKLTRDGNGLWHTDVHSLRWTREVEHLAFFAFAPFDLPVTSGPATTPALSGLTIEDPATQEDILLAHIPEYDAMPSVVSQKVPLVFFHPLAALEIKNGTEYPLTDVKLQGVKDRASAYYFASKTWTLSSHTVSYSLANVPAGETSQKYLLLPQELSGVTLTFSVNGSPVEARLSGRWEQGQLFTYTVGDRVWEYVLDIPETTLDLAFGPTQDEIQLESYKTDGYNQVQADWTVSYYSDEACNVPITKPSWLTVSGNEATGTPGKASALTISTVENDQGGVEQVQGDDAIRNAPEKGLWNLAHKDGTYGTFTESANCYIVNSPGWYVFPLVMGNAIKNNSWNYPAYQGKVDYKGNTIESDARLGGWTLNPSTQQGVRSGIPTTAKVLWEDVPGLIYADANYVLPPAMSGTSSPIYGDLSTGNSVYQLFFYVPAWLERMKGNAVIGVFDADGVLMWSWHIWVTDYKPGQGDISFGNVTFMPENIGEVRFVNKYPDHTVYVKVSSAGNAGLSHVIKVMKAGGEGSQITRTYNPFFQHGRKDPFIPGTGNGPEDLPVYGVNSRTSHTEDNSAIRVGGSRLTIAEAIRHPNWFGPRNDSQYWTGDAHTHLWSTTQKTIYDPSPVGYRVPDYNSLWNNAELRTAVTNYPDNRVVSLRNSAGEELYFPLSGARSGNSDIAAIWRFNLSVRDNDHSGTLWTADLNNTETACWIMIRNSQGMTSTERDPIRGREGMSVRAVAD